MTIQETLGLVVAVAIAVWIFTRVLLFIDRKITYMDSKHTREYLHVQAEIKGEVRDFAIIFVDNKCRGAVEMFKEIDNDKAEVED